MMSSFEVYQTYLALKNHFTKQNYDFHKYNGKVPVKVSSFETRKDKYFFQRLTKKKDPFSYMLANFVDTEVNWVGDLDQEQGEERYKDWLKRNQSLTYIFRQDLDKLHDDFDQNVLVKNGERPYLLQLYCQREICIETLIIINDLVSCFKHWHKNIEDPVIWPTISMKCYKYRPFMNYDKEKCKKILRERFC